MRAQRYHRLAARIVPAGLGLMLAAASLGGGLFLARAAESPPFPDFFWPYGRVLAGGANISPEIQPVVAVINQRNCGTGTTKLALPDPGNPPDDVGRTVYVIDVSGDGSSASQRAGCGKTGDPVTLYFPQIHRAAIQTPTFQLGGIRANLDLGPVLTFRRLAVQVSADGSN